MNIKNIIPRKSERVVSVRVDQTVAAAVALMSDRQIGLVVVVDGAGEVAGVVSERDVVKALARHGAAVMDLQVSEIAVREVITCPGEAHPHDVLNKMYEHNIRHMPVVEDGKLRALISSRDIIKHLANHTSPDEQAMMWAKLVGLG